MGAQKTKLILTTAQARELTRPCARKVKMTTDETERAEIVDAVEDWARTKLELQCLAECGVSPCDSYGVCEHCSEIHLLRAGASKALKIQQERRLAFQAQKESR